MTELVQNGDALVIRGRLDISGATALYSSPPAFSASSVIVDLSEIEELDSAGLALLVHWSHLARNADQSFQLRGAGEQAENLIRISGLESMLVEN